VKAELRHQLLRRFSRVSGRHISIPAPFVTFLVCDIFLFRPKILLQHSPYTLSLLSGHFLVAIRRRIGRVPQSVLV
jgi:hypothetical protein